MRGVWMVLGLGLGVVGCKEAAPPPAPPPAPEEAPAPAPPPVGARMNGATRTAPMGVAPMGVARPDEARVRVDLAGVRAAIREHQMLNNGANPPSVESMDLRLSFPGDLNYDPTTGTVRSKTYPQY